MATANAVGVESSESPAVCTENGRNPSPVWTSVQVGGLFWAGVNGVNVWDGGSTVKGWSDSGHSHVGQGFLATGVMRNRNKIQQRELLDDGQGWVG